VSCRRTVLAHILQNDDFGVGSWIGISKFSLNDTGRIFDGPVKKMKMEKKQFG